jgi:hypothetical protein
MMSENDSINEPKAKFKKAKKLENYNLELGQPNNSAMQK